MEWMRSLKWFFALLILLVCSGCKNDVRVIGGHANPHVYRTTVSLSPSTTEIAEMNLHITLEGRTASCDFPDDVKRLPVVMTGLKPDYEKIVKLRPDVVLYDPTLFSPTDLAKFKELGIPTIGIGGYSLDEFVKSLYAAAAACAAETQVSEYVDRINKNVDNASGNAPKTAPRTIALMPGTGGEHMILGTDSFLGDIIKKCGGNLIGPKAHGFQPMNAESVLKEDPQVIIVAGDPKAVLDDPRLQNTTAVKKRNIFGLKPNLALREGGQVQLLVNDVAEVFVRAKL